MAKTKLIKKTLKNGLRVLLVPRPDSLAVSVSVLVAAGSEYETKDINGLSHFLEHMCFKATTRRPNARDISSELDSLGAEYNAFTGQEYTGYWAKAVKNKFDGIFDVVSDMYLNPTLPAEEIEKERGVIIEEINMYTDTPRRQVHEMFQFLMFGDQPAGWSIAGPKEVVRKLTREDFVQYRASRYIPSNTIVAIAGGFDPKKALKKIESTFGLPPKKTSPKKVKTIPYLPKEFSVVSFKESDQTHLVLGVPGLTIFDKNKYVLEVLGEVLGGGMSSRLFYRIRDVLGAAYYISAGADLNIDHGSFAVWAGADNKRVKDVIAAITEEMSRLTRELVPATELQKAKDHLTGGVVLSLEGADRLAEFYASQEMLTGEMVTPEEYVKKVQAVTAAQIRSLAKKLFTEEPLRLAVIGPWKDLSVFTPLLKI
jgi:predicted Zn-dependent peptidase